MNENDLAKQIVDASYTIHQKLGPGLLESVYEVVLTHELIKRGLHVERQKAISIRYDNITFDQAFYADIIVEDTVIIELKSIEKVKPLHKKQLLTYLKLTGKRLGLLINFGDALIKNGIYRIVNGLPE
jgi:GxxExxY protein